MASQVKPKNAQGGAKMAKLTRWDPFGHMWSLRDAMDRLFEDALVRPWSVGSDGAPVSTLAIDMYETADDVVVTASVPGVRAEDIEITVQGDTLTIRGETRTEHEVTEEAYHYRERRHGRFHRRVGLPRSVRSDAAEASFENGILRLRLPKVEEAHERKIPVTSPAPQMTVK